MNQNISTVNGQIDLDGLTRKTRRMEFDDGLNDMQNGIVFLVLGFLVAFGLSETGARWFISLTIQYGDLVMLIFIILVVAIAGLLFGFRRAIDRYRQNSLWIQSGYVRSIRWQVDSRINILAVLVFLIVMSLGFAGVIWGNFDDGSDVRFLAAGAGIATGVVYAGMGVSLHLRRYLWVGIVGGTLSAFLIIIPISFSLSWLLLGIIWGLVLVSSGILAYFRFRQEWVEQSHE
jgi:hypothetical protein